MSYRRICDNEADSYIWMEAKRYVDETENIAILTLHNAKVIPDTIVNMEQELRKKRISRNSIGIWFLCLLRY